jgi:hypothetical protein
VRLRVDLDFHFSGNCPKPRMTDPAISWRKIAITLTTHRELPEGGSGVVVGVNASLRQLSDDLSLAPGAEVNFAVDHSLSIIQCVAVRWTVCDGIEH